jgi:UDP-N-acetylmuramoylalanine--D-glutamate ligase
MSAQQGRRVHIIAGGADKRTDLQPLAGVISQFAASVALLDGTATPQLKSLLDGQQKVQLGVFTSMSAAVNACREVAQEGDVVLLSPGCASFGLFRDEFDRGEQFRQAVAALRKG